MNLCLVHTHGYALPACVNCWGDSDHGGPGGMSGAPGTGMGGGHSVDMSGGSGRGGGGGFSYGRISGPGMSRVGMGLDDAEFDANASMDRAYGLKPGTWDALSYSTRNLITRGQLSTQPLTGRKDAPVGLLGVMANLQDPRSHPGVRDYLGDKGWAFTGSNRQWGWSSGIPGLGKATQIGGVYGTGKPGPWAEKIKGFMFDVFGPRPAPVDPKDLDRLMSSIVTRTKTNDPRTQRALQHAFDKGYLGFDKAGNLTENKGRQAMGFGAHKGAMALGGSFMATELAPKAHDVSPDFGILTGVAGLGLKSLSGVGSVPGMVDLGRQAASYATARQGLVDAGLVPGNRTPADFGGPQTGGPMGLGPAVEMTGVAPSGTGPELDLPEEEMRLAGDVYHAGRLGLSMFAPRGFGYGQAFGGGSYYEPYGFYDPYGYSYAINPYAGGW